MNDRALELKVGLVLLAALVILGAFVLFLGDLRFERGIRVNVDYEFSGAIQQGAPVKVSGITVGRVEDVVFVAGQPSAKGEQINVRLVLSVEERARPVLREKTEFFVNTQGLLGENYVEIVPPKTESPPLADGATVRGVDPARFDLLVAKLYELLDSVSVVLRDNREVFVDLLRAGASLAGSLDRTLASNDQDVARAIKNVAIATDGAVELVDALKLAVGDGKKLATTVDGAEATVGVLSQRLPELLAKLEKALDEVNRISGALADVDRAKVTSALQNATTALEQANALLGDAGAITKRVRAGQGTVGLLLQDDEIYDDLKELLRDLKRNPWKLIWKD
ncbi:MlaD family protein [Myxococcota bacterium]|nr:MlaD family protein [Myxococcota bacterium]